MRSPNESIHAHAGKVIRDAGHPVLDVLRVDSAGDTGFDKDMVLYIAPGPKPMIAYLTVVAKAGMAVGRRVHVSVRSGWDL